MDNADLDEEETVDEGEGELKHIVEVKHLSSQSVGLGEVAMVDLDWMVDLDRCDKLRRVSHKALKIQRYEKKTSADKKRLASHGKIKEGDRVKVVWGGTFYSCKVVKARQASLKVHYMDWSAAFDEWVPYPSFRVKLDK